MKSDIAGLALIFLLVFILRLPSAERVVVDWDESLSFTVAQDMVNGGIPYLTSWEHKGPILFFILAVVIKLFGSSIFCLRIFTTFYLLVSMFFTYLIGKRLYSGRVRLIPPLIYGLFFTSSRFGGLASNTEIFMMLPVVVAAYCFVVYLQEKKYSMILLFSCGFFSAIAIFIKPVAVFIIALFPVVLSAKRLKIREYSWRLFLKETACFTAGIAVACVSVFSFFMFHHAFAEFYYGFYTFNARYIDTISAERGLLKLCLFLYNITIREHNIFALSAMASLLILFLRKRDRRPEKNAAYFIIGLLCFSIVGVYWGRNMYPHYFLQMGLAFSLLIASAAHRIREEGAHRKRISNVLLAILLFVVVLSSDREFYGMCRAKKEAPFYKISEYIKSNTLKHDTIFVLYGEPIIYFLSDRKAPTKYFFWLHHYGRWQEILHNRDLTLEAFSKSQPAYFVYYTKEKRRRVCYLEKFMEDNYSFEKKFGDYVLYARKNGIINPIK